MPTLVLFAKITPDHIEATVFAVLTGMFNFVNTVLSPNAGIIVNKWFVGVTSQDLSGYYILSLIALVMSLTQFLYIGLIPTKEEYSNQRDNNIEPSPIMSNDANEDTEEIYYFNTNEKKAPRGSSNVIEMKTFNA